jgi:hypothetical protein
MIIFDEYDIKEASEENKKLANEIEGLLRV